MITKRITFLALLALPVLVGPLAAAGSPTTAASPMTAHLACTEPMTNGGFEAGVAPWESVSAGGYTLISPILPYTGEMGAVLAAYNNADDELAQAITLPGGTTAVLRFWWQMMTQEVNHPRDTLDITITPIGGGAPVTLRRITDGDTADSWQLAVLDLTPYAGQKVRLVFHAQTDGQQPTDFYLDDVSVEACPGRGTATPTPSVTAPPSPTKTATPTATQTAAQRRVYLPLLLR
jgi:hypothetical protein